MNILFDYVSYILSVHGIESAAGEIDTSVASNIESGANSGVLLEKYVGKLNEIAAVLVDYRNLVYKDAQDFSAAGKEMTDADLSLKY